MGKTAFTTTLLLLLILFPVSPSTAEIKSFTITSDTRRMILLEKFGFTHKGHVSIAVSVAAEPPDPSRLGFLLVSEGFLQEVLTEMQQNPSFCVLDSRYIMRLLTFRDLSPPPTASFNRSFPVTFPNDFNLFFANCAPKTSISMAIHTVLFNLNADGSRDYLSAGQAHLPSLFFLFSLAYFAFLAFWLYTCYANKHSLHRIHLLMATLLLMNALNLLCAAEYKQRVKVTGTPHGWDIESHILQFIRSVLLFTVIVLFGTGWSFLKPFLEDREKSVLMVVTLLQVLANLASAVTGETGLFTTDWVIWNQIEMLADIVCCCVVVLPVLWSMKSLEETSNADAKAGNGGNSGHLTLFRQFYIVVIGFLFFTRIVLFAIGKTITTAYKHQWVNILGQETATLVFCIVVSYMCRPVQKNECFVLDDEEEEAANPIIVLN